MPPNQFAQPTPSTPSICLIFCAYESGSENTSDTELRVTRRADELAFAPAYQASTIVRSMPNAAIATTMPTIVSVVRSLCRKVLRRTSSGTNIVAGCRQFGSGAAVGSTSASVVMFIVRARRACCVVPSSIDEHALLEMHDPVCLLGRLRVVRHHDDRLAKLGVQPLEQAQDLLGGRAIEVAGRLVGDDQR